MTAVTGAPTTIRVATAAPYDVVVGPGLLERLPGLLGERVRRVGLVHPAVLATLAGRVEQLLRAAGYAVTRLPVPDAEAAKTAAVAESCWAALGQAGFTRSDALVGVGGGATTDLAGFVAATWLRGVRVVYLPTTLLAMVDAAVGGKTGINTAAGKNLVGCFFEPAGVLCDLDLLAGLPRAEYVPGLGEVVKCGFAADPAILDLIEADPAAACVPAGPVAAELICRAVRWKAAVVAGDLRETAADAAPDAAGAGAGLGREVLNYGHTLAHAVERHAGYRLRHGAAVSIGLVYVAELARLAGRLDAATAERHRAVLGSLGLPTGYPADAWPELHAAMRLDKKARGDLLRFVVLDGLARPAILQGPSEQLLRAAYQRVAGRAG